MRSFVEAIRRPHGDYEVLFPITDLQLGTRTLRIGQVAFEQFDREQLGSIGHEPEPLELLFAQAIKEFEGRAVARVHVMAGSQGRAVARAQEAADTALALFRISFHEFRAHIWDEQLLQRRAPVHLVRTPPPKRQILPGWRREFGSLGNLELDDALAAAHDQAVRRFVPALDGSIRGKLGSALIRAVQWMGGSMLRERYDDKVVDLCAALECFLTSQQDRRKGEAIALRSMLLSMALGQGFEHPATTLYLYELRSRVVHGSERDLCGRTDYRSLLGVTYDSLAQAITLIQQRSLTQLSAFLRGLEDESLIKQAHAWIAAQDDEHSQALARFALERLGESSLGRSHGHASRSAGDRRSGQGTAGK